MNYAHTVDFSWPETTPAPMIPLRDGKTIRQTPEEIIGPSARQFKEFFRIAKKNGTDGSDPLMVDILKFLRSHGWWPDHFDSVGRLVFEAAYVQNVVLHKKLQEPITEKDIDSLYKFFSPGFVELIERKLRRQINA